MSIIQEPWSILYVEGVGPKGDKGDPGTGVGVSWVDVTDKPVTFPPEAHTQEIASITGLQTALDAKATSAQGELADTAIQPTDLATVATSGLYGDLTGVPSTFPPSAHGHAIADVSGLQTALDGKQPAALVLSNTTASFTTAQESKLAGIATGATANSPDATLLARANHTGTQLAATISDLAAAVAATPAVTANTAKVSNATHTGDVTGSTDLTIANNAVTNAKAADVPTATIKGRATAGTGDPEDLTAAQVRTLINVADGAQVNVPTDLSYTPSTRLLASSTGADVNLPLFTGTDAGLVPASGGGTTNFLRADGTFAAPAGGGGGALEVANWAALLALSGIPDGRVYTVMAPLITGGAPGTMWKRDSASLSGWRPAGRQVIYMSRTEVVGTTTTNEQIQRTIEIPGGVLTGCLMIVPTARTSWSAADGATRSSRWRLGSLGTLADAVIGVFQTVPSTSRQSLHSQAYVADSTTLLSQWQMLSIQNTSWVGQVNGTNALTFDTYTVDSMASTIYLSATQQQAGTPTAVPTLEFFALEIA